jgi:hypothetical protein
VKLNLEKMNKKLTLTYLGNSADGLSSLCGIKPVYATSATIGEGIDQ